MKSWIMPCEIALGKWTRCASAAARSRPFTVARACYYRGASRGHIVPTELDHPPVATAAHCVLTLVLQSQTCAFYSRRAWWCRLVVLAFQWSLLACWQSAAQVHPDLLQKKKKGGNDALTPERSKSKTKQPLPLAWVLSQSPRLQITCTLSVTMNQ